MARETVPELSLAAFTAGGARERLRFAEQLSQGLQRFGFVTLRDHAVPVALLDEAYGLARELFARPVDEKLRHRGGLRGYTPFGTEHAKDSRFPDLKEFWQIGREPLPPGTPVEEVLPPNVWPPAWQRFREVFTTLYAGLDSTGRTLLAALAPGLGLAPDWFEPHVCTGNSILRLIHYPPIPADADPRCVRSAAHEDINFLTILVAARGAGLELLDRDGRWLPVETASRNLIVDSGDMLARLTNGVIPATTHRVVNPSGPNVSRYSMPFFMHPASAMSLACLSECVGDGARYPPITAGEFLEQRLREIGLAAN